MFNYRSEGNKLHSKHVVPSQSKSLIVHMLGKIVPFPTTLFPFFADVRLTVHITKLIYVQ